MYLSAICFSLLSAQTKKNIEVIFNLVDKSLSEVKNSDEQNYVLKFNSVDNLDVIKGRVAYNLKNSAENAYNELNYTVDTLNVKYPELYRDGLFGDYFLVREIKYSGYYSVINDEQIINNKKFNFD